MLSVRLDPDSHPFRPLSTSLRDELASTIRPRHQAVGPQRLRKLSQHVLHEDVESLIGAIATATTASTFGGSGARRCELKGDAGRGI